MYSVNGSGSVQRSTVGYPFPVVLLQEAVVTGGCTSHSGRAPYASRNHRCTNRRSRTDSTRMSHLTRFVF